MYMYWEGCRRGGRAVASRSSAERREGWGKQTNNCKQNNNIIIVNKIIRQQSKASKQTIRTGTHESEDPLENAAGNPLGNSSKNPLAK